MCFNWVLPSILAALDCWFSYSLLSGEDVNPFRSLPSQGSYRAAPVALDYDGDGDLDIVANSNWKLHLFRHDEGFVYTKLSGTDNPFDGLSVLSSSAPSFVGLGWCNSESTSSFPALPTRCLAVTAGTLRWRWALPSHWSGLPVHLMMRRHGRRR